MPPSYPDRRERPRSERVRRKLHAHLRLRAPLVQETRVIEAFVAIGELLEYFIGLATTIRGVSTELVGDGQAQETQRQLVFGLNRQDVAADRLCLLGFIE